LPALKLRATLEDLSREYVLVQAWKKASNYIRYHNWFSDTLELDRVAINLPEFISELSQKILSKADSVNSPLRIVPAPKSQTWHVDKNDQWKPIQVSKIESKIRPLAHVLIQDQVIATALMLCLADRVETLQGDPRTSLDSKHIKNIVSYGNRLFCDLEEDKLFHRWGSSKLYRSFSHDYQTFITRPESKADQLASEGKRALIFQSDLRQFYDRVSHDLLSSSIDSLKQKEDEEEFFEFAKRFLKWNWSVSDLNEVQIYAKQAGIVDFSQVSLPQGLVAAGFFANVSLLKFDKALTESIDQRPVGSHIKVHDAIRYVDDLRFVVSAPANLSLEFIQERLLIWLKNVLNECAPGLSPADDKTRILDVRGDERPLVQQSRRMARIQSAISGGFDETGGGEILDAVIGLVRSQARMASDEETEEDHPFLPIPDVRDATVDRFAAARFRRTYRSLRPLLYDTEERKLKIESVTEPSYFRGARTKDELDDEAKAFALELIGKWVKDPSNVRLLRIGLDLWPAVDVLQKVLKLLRPFTVKGGLRKAPKRVAWYCLSEILRAGATETGFIDDREALPKQLDINAYREELKAEAYRLIKEKEVNLPWYLKQQAYLFLISVGNFQQPLKRSGRKEEVKSYKNFLIFLTGRKSELPTLDIATFAVLAQRSFLSTQKAIELLGPLPSPSVLNRIASLDPSFIREIISSNPILLNSLSPRIAADIGMGRQVHSFEGESLAKIVLSRDSEEFLRNEISLLSFSLAFLEQLRNSEHSIITPSDVVIKFDNSSNVKKIAHLQILTPRQFSGSSLYDLPKWASDGERWRFQLGYLLRFILTADEDFTRVIRRPRARRNTQQYRPPESHWYQRLYGSLNSQSAFGDDWLPITEWIENFLYSLLAWPGCPETEKSAAFVRSLDDAASLVQKRLSQLLTMQGATVPIFPITLPRNFVENSNASVLRACVVQTVIPGQAEEFDVGDLTLSGSQIRTKHRRHLSAALATVERALVLRETHKGADGRLDWLIFPELAVHPEDIQTHLLPFARAYKTAILAGITYECLRVGDPLVNSALWIMPTQQVGGGFRVIIRRQGKAHLAQSELEFNKPTELIRSFRPCQWIVGYQWGLNADPLWMTASICYDATDIRLAADLSKLSDVFAVPALNKDIGTFDQMALALHYHMYQLVVVANNGIYGGSNAYAPFKNSWDRQIFHLHGQPQASMAFFEIDIPEFKARKALALQNSGPSPKFKWPPAGHQS